MAQYFLFLWIWPRRHWQHSSPVNSLIMAWNYSIFHLIWILNSTSSLRDWFISLVAIYSVLLAQTVTQNNFTFLSRGKPRILMIFPETNSCSFHIKLSRFWYFLTPPVSSTKRFFFNGNNKFYLNYQSVPLIFENYTNYPLVLS